MNTLTIPPSPNWYEDQVLACAPDNTLIYGARNDIVILENNDNINQAANVRIIPRAHIQRIQSINLNKNWGQPKKLVVTASEDKIIKIWDIENGKKLASHNKHISDTKVVSATFAGEDRVVSVSEEGNVIVWNISVNETKNVTNLFGMKVMVTCLSTCPHATWLTAFGIKSGLVIVADLRKNGKVLYKMRGHDKPVVSLAWCPVPINIFPKHPSNFVCHKDAKNKIIQNVELSSPETSHPFLKVFELKEKEFLRERDIIKKETLACSGNSKEEVVDVGECSTKNLENISDNVTKIIHQNDKTINDEFQIAETSKHEESQSDEIGCDQIPIIEKTNNQEHELDNAVENKKNLAVTSDSNSEELKHDQIKHENEELTESEKFDSKLQDNNEKNDINVDETMDSNQSQILVELNESSIKERITVEKKLSVVDDNSSVVATTSDENTDIENKTKTCEEAGRNIIKSKREDPRKEFLLASSAKENNIYIWRAGTDGRMQTFLTLPHKSVNRKQQKSDKTWISLCWVAPTLLLSSSKQNELIAWHLPKSPESSKLMTVVHKNHTTQVFSIASSTVLKDELNWQEETQIGNVWTTGLDRLLLNTTVTDNITTLAQYPTLGAPVNFMQLSPLDPNRLAIGTSDFFIKIWDLSQPNVKTVNMKTFYNKIHSKVTCLAWHPKNELILAFGTNEGRVGYLDPTNKSKTTISFQQYFKSQIYKLEWAPINGKKDKFGLYAVSEGRIVIFDVDNLMNGPFEIFKPDDVFIYSLAWTPDYSLLFAITKAGYLIIYSPKLKIICKHYFQYRLQEIVWHPNASNSSCKHHNWFAAISNFKTVVVYQFGIDSGNNDDNIINMYQGESDLVHAIAWNPHEPSQLVIACEIGIAQVWNVESGEILSTFINTNYEGIVSIIWSPLDADYIISGGKDNTLKIWKVSEHPALNETEVLKNRKKFIKENAAGNNHVLVKEGEKEEEITDIKSKKPVKKSLLPNFYAPKNNHQIVSGLKKLLAWRENSENTETTNETSANDILNIFGSDSAMRDLVSANEKSHKKRGKYKMNATLSLFRGDTDTAIKEAISEKRVTPQIISIAPMVSPKLWQAACETYADQLYEQSGSDPLEIATYYLACHKVENAVDTLTESAMYREALALAKCRMLGKEVVSNIIEKWASHARDDGNFEVAAQCYVYLGKYEDAATLLFRRTDLQILEFVVELSEKSGNQELHNAAVYRYNVVKADKEKDNENRMTLPTKQEAFLQQKSDDLTKVTENDKELIEQETCEVKENDKELIKQGNCEVKENDKEIIKQETCEMKENDKELIKQETCEVKENEKELIKQGNCEVKENDKELIKQETCEVKENDKELIKQKTCEVKENEKELIKQRNCEVKENDKELIKQETCNVKENDKELIKQEISEVRENEKELIEQETCEVKENDKELIKQETCNVKENEKELIKQGNCEVKENDKELIKQETCVMKENDKEIIKQGNCEVKKNDIELIEQETCIDLTKVKGNVEDLIKSGHSSVTEVSDVFLSKYYNPNMSLTDSKSTETSREFTEFTETSSCTKSIETSKGTIDISDILSDTKSVETSKENIEDETNSSKETDGDSSDMDTNNFFEDVGDQDGFVMIHHVSESLNLSNI